MRTEIGDSISFTPYCLIDNNLGNLTTHRKLSRRGTVTGIVDYINVRHGWYRVRYELPGEGAIEHECFPVPVDPDPEYFKEYAWFSYKVKNK